LALRLELIVRLRDPPVHASIDGSFHGSQMRGEPDDPVQGKGGILEETGRRPLIRLVDRRQKAFG
jgi:hypothetical protein